MFAGEIEVDESYFGGARKGKRGRGAAGKIPVFGLLIPSPRNSDSIFLVCLIERSRYRGGSARSLEEPFV
jgi:transposase-like protein